VKIVVDTNILFSTLIIKNPKREEILFDISHTFFTPNFAFWEIYDKKEKILRYTKRTTAEFYEIFERILSVVQFVRNTNVSLESKREAYRLCKDIDLKDMPFIALAIDLTAPLWTGDTRLRSRLIKRGYSDFFQV
jgi:predicted nucleic acid-binding protein